MSKYPKKEEFGLPEDSSAPFNMALDTLKRLGDILREIKDTSSDVAISEEYRQLRKIHLVKQFYIQAVPLLPKEIVKKFKSILNIQPKQNVQYRKTGLTNIQPSQYIYSFDFKLEYLLDTSLVDLQTALQDEKYFMPSKNDPRFSWSHNQ